MNGPEAIGYTDILAYQQVLGFVIPSWAVTFVLRLDDCLLSLKE